MTNWISVKVAQCKAAKDCLSDAIYDGHVATIPIASIASSNCARQPNMRQMREEIFQTNSHWSLPCMRIGFML